MLHSSPVRHTKNGSLNINTWFGEKSPPQLGIARREALICCRKCFKKGIPMFFANSSATWNLYSLFLNAINCQRNRISLLVFFASSTIIFILRRAWSSFPPTQFFSYVACVAPPTESLKLSRPAWIIFLAFSLVRGGPLWTLGCRDPSPLRPGPYLRTFYKGGAHLENGVEFCSSQNQLHQLRFSHTVTTPHPWAPAGADHPNIGKRIL